jgi:hypothetical protein
MRILCDSLEEPFLWFPLSYEAGFHDLPPPYTFLYLIRSYEPRSPLFHNHCKLQLGGKAGAGEKRLSLSHGVGIIPNISYLNNKP